MKCPDCGRQFSLFEIYIEPLLWKSDLYHRYLTRTDEKQERKDLAELKGLVDKISHGWSEYLTEREFNVVLKRISHFTIDEIADQMNVTRERIRQIQAKALRKLRKIT